MSQNGKSSPNGGESKKHFNKKNGKKNHPHRNRPRFPGCRNCCLPPGSMFSHLVTVLSSAMFTGKNRGEQRQWAANAGGKITLTTVNYRMSMGKTTSYFWCSMSYFCNKGFPKRIKNEPEVISVKVLWFKIGGNFKIHTSWATKNRPKVLLELFCVADNFITKCR